MRYSGMVTHGVGRGKSLGYPTANLDIESELPDGLYYGWTCIRDAWYKSLVFIGQSLTFQDYQRKFEVYLLNFHNEIYNEMVEVEVLEKLRDNIHFKSSQDLVHQMKKDEADAEIFFKANPRSL